MLTTRTILSLLQFQKCQILDYLLCPWFAICSGCARIRFLRGVIVWLNGDNVTAWYDPLLWINVGWRRSITGDSNLKYLVTFGVSFIIAYLIWPFVCWCICVGAGTFPPLVFCCCCSIKLDAFFLCKRPCNSSIRWSTDRSSAWRCCNASRCKCNRASCCKDNWLRYYNLDGVNRKRMF